MIRPPIGVLALGVFLTISFFSLLSSADVNYLVDQLTNATDFRVRTQAALALGASEEKDVAVSPLCGALDDTNDSVRSAAAAALGKLKHPKGLPCLKAHLGEPSASVHSVIERSAKLLQGGGKPGKPPLPGPNDSVYVAIAPVSDKTGRGDKSVADAVRAIMQDKLLSFQGYAVAPEGESGGAARKIIKKHGSLKGYLLRTRVEPPRAEGDELIIQVGVTMWSYPGGDLKGSFSPKLRMQGASPGDRASEDSLLKMAVENAVETFAKQAASMN
jgi:HEAT repeat protein